MAAPVGVGWMALFAAAAAGLGWAGLDAYGNRHWRHETGSAFGAASWATKRKLERAGLFGPEGVALGRFAGKLLRVKSDRHLLTVAPNRAGKGVSSIIPNLLTWPGSMVVVDPKGENAVVTARRRRDMGQLVHVLDPWGVSGLPRSRFNPLLWLEPFGEGLAEDAALIADSLVASEGEGEARFWLNEARALIAGLIMHVATVETPQHRHLGRVRELLTEGEDSFSALLNEMAGNNAASGLVARAARRLMQKSRRERSSVISTAQAETHFLDTQAMANVLAASDFDLQSLKQGRMTVYLVLPADRLATHGRWLRLMVGLCLAELTRKCRPPAHSVLFLLDEFAALGRLQAIETAMGLLAGYGVQLWPVLQDFSQLQDLYPRRWRSFLANAGVVQAFGVNDMGTAEYLSSLLGTRTVTVRQRSRNAASGAHGGAESYGPAARPLLMPHEIMQLPAYQQLVLLQGQAPILADKIRYYAEPEFAGLFDVNPMVGGKA